MMLIENASGGMFRVYEPGSGLFGWKWGGKNRPELDKKAG